MANEVKWTYASQVTLASSGASAASNIFVAADLAALTSTNNYNYPLADLVLYVAFGGTPAAGGTVNVYRQDLTIDGANGAPAPGSAFKSILVGIVQPSGSTAAYYPIPNVPLASSCQFSLENGTNQNLSAAWTLKATPKTYVPGA